MTTDPLLLAHQEWLGYLQPAGLVVSPPALVKAQAIVAANVIAQQQALVALVAPHGDDEVPSLPDFGAFTRDVLGWDAADLVAPPEALEVALPAYQDVLRPTFAVPDPEYVEGAPGTTAATPGARWVMLVQVIVSVR